MDNLGIFYDHLVYFTAIGNAILWPFSIFYGHSVYFSPFLVFCTKKNLATLELARRSMFKKGKFVSANLHPILCSEERFCRGRPLKNCSLEVNYLV
jgi:hypothetical protein